jgi:hypothetical protein
LHLALTLLVARIAANNIHPPLTADKLAVRTAGFYRSFYFHNILEPPGDAAFAAVWVELNEDFVPDKHFYTVEAHLTGKVA